MRISLNLKQAVVLGLGGSVTLYVLWLPPWKIGDVPIPYTRQSPFSRYVYWIVPVEAPAETPERDWPRLLLFLAVIQALTFSGTLALRTRRPDDGSPEFP